MPGLINLDFADVRSVMQEMGKAMMGTGEAEGDDRALIAAQKAIANPLLDGVSMQGAKGVIISITGGEDMRLLEVDEAANHIRDLVDPEANIIWGSAFNPDLEGKIRVSVVATGIEAQARDAAPAASAAEPTRGFSFTAPRRAEAPAAAPAPAPAAPAQPVAQAPAEPAPPASVEDDELVLGSEEMIPAPAAPPAEPRVFDDAPAASAGAPASEGTGRRRWLASGDEASAEPAPPQPRVKLGGTLFERMQNASRGAQPQDESASKEPLDIPRFLHRQNNQ
jgi:cell division protein FtsZ